MRKTDLQSANQRAVSPRITTYQRLASCAENGIAWHFSCLAAGVLAWVLPPPLDTQKSNHSWVEVAVAVFLSVIGLVLLSRIAVLVAPSLSNLGGLTVEKLFTAIAIWVGLTRYWVGRRILLSIRAGAVKPQNLDVLP